MNIENLTQAQIDALSASATGTIKIYEPVVAGSPSFVPMAGAIVKVNGVKLVEGVHWTAATSRAATATSLAGAITTATATTLCTASPDGTDTALVVITANSDGPNGNGIHISVTMPNFTFPSGPTLLGGALPSAGDLVFNSDDTALNVYNGSAWIEVSAVVPTAWGAITGTLSAQTDLKNALDAKQDA